MIFQKWKDKVQARKDALNKAREDYVSWVDVSKSLGWKAYQERIEKKIEIIRDKITNDTTLTGEDLKRLQLALQVWKSVQRIPEELLDNAKGGIKS